MIIRNGSPEHITKSLEYGYASGNRPAEGYIVMVHVAGDDTYEVGLSALRKCLGGLRSLTQNKHISSRKTNRKALPLPEHTLSISTNWRLPRNLLQNGLRK